MSPVGKNTLVRFSALALSLLGVVALFWQVMMRETRPVVKEGKGRLGVVEFPKFWMKDDGSVLGAPNQYEVRGGPAAERLVFALREQSYADGLSGGSRREEWYETPPLAERAAFSVNYHAVALDGQFKATPSTAEEWAHATPLLHSQHFVTSPVAAPATQSGSRGEDAVKYGGRAFAKSGSFWGNPAALVSPDRQWIAVLSYSSTEETPHGLIPGLGGGTEPQNGRLFLDVYNTASGAKALAGYAPYANVGPSLLFRDSLWVESRYFILPLDYLHQRCFLGFAQK